jgi:Leucine-rich repeat (LRR) protein
MYFFNNRLTELDIYGLGKLQYLDISNNFIKELGDMSLLHSLRALDASYNNISSCRPFQALTGLIQLSLKANNIRKLSGFTAGNRQDQQQQLESLDLSFNRIECLDSIDEPLKYLRELNLDHNDIKCIQLVQPMDRLCKLKLSFNRLKSFDVSPFPDIRILYLDDNQIQRIIGVACISRLDSFSIRDQGRQKV